MIEMIVRVNDPFTGRSTRNLNKDKADELRELIVDWSERMNVPVTFKTEEHL